MTTILVETRISAPIELCFDLARDVDEMVNGAFASLRHIHEFFSEGSSVIMRDTLIWRSPLGFLGVIADKLLLERHMRSFMVTKQLELKACAEGGGRAGAKHP